LLQSGTSKKQLKLRDERERLRICRERLAPLLAKKELRLHERNEPNQIKVNSLVQTGVIDVPFLLIGIPIGLAPPYSNAREATLSVGLRLLPALPAIIFDRLFFPPYANSIYFASSRDLLHPFSGRLYLIY